MTTRPIDSKSLRGPLCSAIALVLVVLLLAAGCTEPTGEIPVFSAKNITQSGSGVASIKTTPFSDRELAEQTVVNAEKQIHKADVVIIWFKGNLTTSNDAQLPLIIAKRENAVSQISIAKDDIASGNFTQARVSSQTAYEKANESYNDALERQYILTHHCKEPTLSFEGIVLIILLCIFPALLTTVLYSLMNTISSPLIESLLQRFRTITFSSFFTWAWISYLSLLLVAAISKTQSLETVALIITIIWTGLILVIILISLIVLGIIISKTIRLRIKKGISDHKTDKELQSPFLGKNAKALFIVLIILLILAMPFAIYLGLKISFPFPCI
jgi:hypothetical protein